MSTIINTAERPLGHNVPHDLYNEIAQDLAANNLADNPSPKHSIIMAHFHSWYRKPCNKTTKKELNNFALGGTTHHARAMIDAKVAATFEALLIRRHTRDDGLVRIALGFGSNYNTKRGRAAIFEAIKQDRAVQL